MNLTDFMTNCTSDEINKITTDNNKYWNLNEENQLNTEVTHNWVKCNYANRANSYITKINKYIEEGKDEATSHELAQDEAEVGEQCSLNSAAGAWFWFTVMTTIGYGNAVPTSTGARLMIYSFGFFSILAFTTSIGHAASVMLIIVDKMYGNSHKYFKHLTHGFPAVLVWFVALLAWLFVITGVHIWYEKYLDGNPFLDTVWWTYASITTIGFGDIHKPNNIIDWGEIFIFGPMLMLGFVLLGNFLIKLAAVLMKYFKSASKYLPSLERGIDEGTNGKYQESEAD